MTTLLFSGGLDSTAISWWKRPDVLLNVDYGQVSALAEKEAATKLANLINLPIEFISVDLGSIGSGDLSRKAPIDIAPTSDWWPFRNQLLISIAAAWSVHRGYQTVMIGSVKSDNSFADSTPSFIDLMRSVLAVQEGNIGIEAPALEMSAVQLIKQSGIPLQILPLCFSCNVSSRPCGMCRSCIKYRETLSFFNLI
ncbi:7-cyano-7-deazaguanine synthase [Luteolibacter pohnpeiensis]|uniref:7-cyano-7-deazaguanine synthase n=1 Tax=Luteolibacter pohnpeiensis TaxID=454153 RepID=A0A934SG57_9BACT|nr:7-cyano-7-deazaguanine synthase [Luteolibacter pohnpeiensis]MBK1884583.1 7-cyano-7-deazaguanine synthase [Luteolibacter pohnpeiensis]